MQSRLKCAVIGARGIGKQHAKWYHLEDCDVVAFAGTSPETVSKTAQVLRELFPFEGRGYTDYREMLEKERPDVVSVCSPYELHREHAVAALECGANVLCEKPMVWRLGASGDEILRQGKEMLEAAEKAGKLLSVNTQYVAVIPFYREIYEEVRGKLEAFDRMFVRLESGGGNGGREYEEVPVDLISHAISLLLKWIPNGKLDDKTVCCEVGRKETTVNFECAFPSGKRCAVRFVFVNKKERPFVRRFGLNDVIVDYTGRNDADGVYKTFLSFEGKEYKFEDLMRLCIRSFVNAVRGEGEPLVSAEEAYRNLELQVELMSKAVRV